MNVKSIDIGDGIKQFEGYDFERNLTVYRWDKEINGNNWIIQFAFTPEGLGLLPKRIEQVKAEFKKKELGIEIKLPRKLRRALYKQHNPSDTN